MTKEQKKRFNEVCKNGKLKSWQKSILKLCVEIAIDEKVIDVNEAIKYILKGKKK